MSSRVMVIAAPAWCEGIGSGNGAGSACGVDRPRAGCSVRSPVASRSARGRDCGVLQDGPCGDRFFAVEVLQLLPAGSGTEGGDGEGDDRPAAGDVDENRAVAV